MINKDNLVHYLVACFTITFMATIVACSSGVPIENIQVPQNMTESETSESISQEFEATSTLRVSTPTAPPTTIPLPIQIPSPTPTDAITPMLTTSPLQKLGELPAGSFPFPTLGITVNGTLLAISVADDENTLYIFDMINQIIKWIIVEDDIGDMVGYSSLTFSSDGRYLAGWNGGWTLFVWDMDNGEVVHKIRFERDDAVNVNSISFSPDGQLLALSSLNVPVLIYSMATGELADEFPSTNIVTYPPTEGSDHFLKPSHHYGEIWEIEFVPNHTNLLAITVNPDPFAEGEGVAGGLYFWNMETQSLEGIITGNGGFQILASPNGQLLVTRISKQLVGWDASNNRATFTITNIEVNTYLASITDAGFFATLSQTEGLKIWDFSGELVATLHPDKPIRGAVFTPDGRLLIAYSDESSPIEVWEIRNKED